MRVDVSRVDIWSALIEDRPGALAEKLDALAQSDIDLEFIISRRSHTKPGTGIVYVTPIKGPVRIKAAREAGFEKDPSPVLVKADQVLDKQRVYKPCPAHEVGAGLAAEQFANALFFTFCEEVPNCSVEAGQCPADV